MGNICGKPSTDLDKPVQIEKIVSFIIMGVLQKYFEYRKKLFQHQLRSLLLKQKRRPLPQQRKSLIEPTLCSKKKMVKP